MAQEFTINSSAIESKINQLLPSQGGLGAGIDFSASTMVIPIVDLTESAEGSGLREDLQKSLSLTSITPFNVANTTTTLVTTTGYYRVFGSTGGGTSTGTGTPTRFSLTDGISTKIIVDFEFVNTSSQMSPSYVFDFIVFLGAGESLTATSTGSVVTISGCTRQIADVSGNLVNPL